MQPPLFRSTFRLLPEPGGFYTGCQKNTPLGGTPFVTITYAAILLSELCYDKRNNAECRSHSCQNFADLPDGRNVGEIWNITAQYGSDCGDALFVSIFGLKVQQADTNIGCRLITTAGYALFNFRFRQTEGF